MIHNYVMVRKAKPFFSERLLPILLIWLGVAAACSLLAHGFDDLATKGGDIVRDHLKIEDFADGKVVGTVALGAFSMVAFVDLVLRNLRTTMQDQAWVVGLVTRIWDELSAAAIHVFCIIIINWGCRGYMPTMKNVLTSLVYFGVGYMAFSVTKDKEETQSLPQTPPQLHLLQPEAGQQQ